MIINTGMRTDIPAFYADWFVNRLKAGFQRNRMAHDPESPLLIGHTMPGDRIHEAKQESWKDHQITLEM